MVKIFLSDVATSTVPADATFSTGSQASDALDCCAITHFDGLDRGHCLLAGGQPGVTVDPAMVTLAGGLECVGLVAAHGGDAGLTLAAILDGTVGSSGDGRNPRISAG